MKNIKLLPILILFSASLLVSCGGDGIGGTGSPYESVSDIQQETIRKISTPFREHGYSNFKTTVIDTQNKLDTFISNVKSQSNWNNKKAFLDAIEGQSIDFSRYNLLLYRITEASGSITLTPQKPVIKNDEVSITINRKTPNIGTSDMAYYALAYIVDKNINKVTFETNAVKTIIDLSNIPKAQGKLVRSNDTELLTYFKTAIKQAKAKNEDLTLSVPTADAINESASVTSTTNLQELGVDEADLIKTDGRYIFSVKRNNNPYDEKQRFSSELISSSYDTIRIMDTKASSGITEIKKLGDKSNSWNIAGLYLHEVTAKNIAEKKQLIAISSEKKNYWDHWFDSNYFSNQKTDVLFIDIKDPSKSTIKDKISFDGQLIDSRRNGNVLYVVLRHYTNYQYTDDKKLATISNEAFLPSYQAGTAKKELIAKPENCYLEKGQKSSADIITLVAIDLTSPKHPINSQCYVGSAEAIYASKKALYLATTRWDYEIRDNDEPNYGKQAVTTDIHKFAYNGLAFDYRGSGEVNGHLGYNQDRKSFRFSEHNDFLRVVTFDEKMWMWDFGIALPEDSTLESTSETDTQNQQTTKSPVLITILKEDENKKTLKVVSKLPNSQRKKPIGLPEERLYATRFIGNRAYVVTFKVTDPVYVLDLSDATDPKIAGELKVDGYSDYLHPISENLLLGIGKDAIPAKSGNGDSGRGAWYQGLKLSLIDVSDPTNPREADKVILGKRGTNSTVLNSHHAFTGLNVGNTYRVAIPVNIYEDTPSYGNVNEASTNYSYSNTGLHRFEIDINNQTINKLPIMVVNTNSMLDNGMESNNYIYNDRSVFIGDNVFYMHQGKFWSQDWQAKKAVTGPK